MRSMLLQLVVLLLLLLLMPVLLLAMLPVAVLTASRSQHPGRIMAQQQQQLDQTPAQQRWLKQHCSRHSLPLRLQVRQAVTRSGCSRCMRRHSSIHTSHPPRLMLTPAAGAASCCGAISAHSWHMMQQWRQLQ